MIERGYQKLKPRLDRERRACRRTIFLSTKMFDVNEFVTIYPDPKHYFAEQRQSSSAYINHAIVCKLSLLQISIYICLDIFDESFQGCTSRIFDQNTHT